MTSALGVALIGYSFMGRAHSQAWRTVHHVFDVPVVPRMVVLVGRDRDAATAAATRLGWADVETDWRRVLDRDDVDLVDVCSPGDTHASIACAALTAGKHVLCEKPLANSLVEAEAMVAAADRAHADGVRAMVGYNYRRVPALALARQMLQSGRLGRVRQVRAQYLQDWLSDPAVPATWRLDRTRAGSGALGDIASHLVDLVQFLVSEPLTGVSALTETFVRQRPTPAGASTDVTVDDAALFLARTSGGSIATFEATRMATGRKNALRVELNAERGSVAFDLERLNELEVYDATETPAGFRRVLVTEPDQPYLHGWWPPGHVLGWEHTFIHQARDLLSALGTGADPAPSFADGLAVQRVLAAVEDSATHGSRWTPVPGGTDA